MKLFLYCAFLLSCLSLYALQHKFDDKNLNRDLENDSTLLPIVVNSPISDITVARFVGSIDYKSKLDIIRSDVSNPANLINTIAGVYMHSGALNTNRITIRGIGARTPFSTNKIRAYFDQIPLTDGIGETTIEDLDMHGLGSITVLKGSSSSVYGAGLGGVILISPEGVEYDHTKLSFSTSVGSFGFQKQGLAIAVGKRKYRLNVKYYRQKSDGYRDNNYFQRNNLEMSGSLRLNKSSLSFLTYAIDQFSEIPSSLNLSDYDHHPSKAAASWANAKGYEEYRKYLMGVTWTRTLGADIVFKNTTYINYKNAYEPRPFNILDEKVFGGGVRSLISWQLGEHAELNSGMEVYTDKYLWSTSENLYQTNLNQGSVAGDLITKNRDDRSYVNIFSELDWQVAKALDLSASVNINKTTYRRVDEFQAFFEEGVNQFNWQVSPKLGLKYNITDSWNIYHLVSRVFSAPDFSQTLQIDGSVNSSIRPEIGWNYEMGSRAVLFKKKLTFNASVYRMRVQNLLVDRIIESEQLISVNAGSTEHYGFEWSLNSKLVAQDDFQMTLLTDGSVNRFRFDEFIEAGNDYSGNQLTGVPAQHLSNQMQVFYHNVSICLEHNFVSQIPITDDNSVFSERYHLFNSVIMLRKSFKNLNGRLSYRMNNIFNKKYASMLSINASSFGGTPRYYYPGLPVNHQISLRLDFDWIKND